MESLKLFLIVFLFCTANSFAAINRYGSSTIKSDDNKVKNVKSKLYSQKKAISNIGVRITQLESELGNKNKKFIKIIKLKKFLDGQIEESQKELSQNKKELETVIANIDKMAKGVMLHGMDENVGAATILAKKLINKKLVKRLKELEKISKENKVLTENIKNLNDRYMDYKNVESSLSTLLGELEYKKKLMADKYMSAKRLKDDLQIQYDQMKTYEKMKQATRPSKTLAKAKEILVNMRFGSPLKEYASFDFKKKGITYKFSGKQDVMATNKGKIVYTGSLSTYGNVIMIDHGNETRSVLLGAFSTSVKKGQVVDAGSVIGRTTMGRGLDTDNKLYFEVRKKNKAQDTIQLMAKKP